MTDKVKLYAVKNEDDKLFVVRSNDNAYLYQDQNGNLGRAIYRYYSREDAQRAIERAGRVNQCHVAELVDAPAKIVVSEEEADMLEQAKDDYCAASVISAYSTEHIGAMGQDRLMRAYVIGWTVAKPKRWNVKVPHATNSYYYDMGWGNGLETQNMKDGTQPLPGFREAQFTQDEINKRGLQHCERVEVTDDEQ